MNAISQVGHEPERCEVTYGNPRDQFRTLIRCQGAAVAFHECWWCGAIVIRSVCGPCERMVMNLNGEWIREASREEYVVSRVIGS